MDHTSQGLHPPPTPLCYVTLNKMAPNIANIINLCTNSQFVDQKY